MAKVTLTHNLDNIPAELKKLVQWVVSHKNKIPIHARTGGNASVSNPGTWSSFERAQGKVRSGEYENIGFIFTKKDPYTCIDLDWKKKNKSDKLIFDLETGEIQPWAQDIIDRMNSYTEVSQSGNGIHIIVRGKKPGIDCKIGQIEVYETGRHLIFTGNVLDGHGTIEDRPEEIITFCQETFSKDTAVGEADYDISDLVLDRNAKPPQDKLKKALRNKKFQETWEHRRTDLTDSSFSGYDAAMASLAVRRNWDDQEIVDMGIALRREYGDEEDIKKGLRPDYWALTLGKARGSGGLRSLKSDMKEIVLYGADEEGEFIIETIDGRFINMGDVSTFLSPSRAYQRLYIAGYVLSPQEKTQWPQMVRDWRPSIRIESTATKLRDFEQWMMNDVSRAGAKPPILSSGSLSNTLSEVTESGYVGVGARGYAVDNEGRLYVHIPSILVSAQMLMGRHLSGKRIAGYLKRMKFEAIEAVHIYREDYQHNRYESKVTIWVSRAGFAPADLYIRQEVVDTEGKGDRGDSQEKPSRSPIEETARKIREKGI